MRYRDDKSIRAGVGSTGADEGRQTSAGGQKPVRIHIVTLSPYTALGEKKQNPAGQSGALQRTTRYARLTPSAYHAVNQVAMGGSKRGMRRWNRLVH